MAGEAIMLPRSYKVLVFILTLRVRKLVKLKTAYINVVRRCNGIPNNPDTATVLSFSVQIHRKLAGVVERGMVCTDEFDVVVVDFLLQKSSSAGLVGGAPGCGIAD